MNLIPPVDGHTGADGDVLRASTPPSERPTLTVSRFDGVITFSSTARHLCGGVPLDSPVCVHLLVCDHSRGDDSMSEALSTTGSISTSRAGAGKDSK
jgi:hypothetical protein